MFILLGLPLPRAALTRDGARRLRASVKTTNSIKLGGSLGFSQLSLMNNAALPLPLFRKCMKTILYVMALTGVESEYESLFGAI